MNSADVVIVGGGIVGLAHAYEAHRRGLTVALFERSPRAIGASIRNFGMFWPIGQPAGRGFARAMRSRKTYLELAKLAGFWADPRGSVHAAYHDDEMDCFHQFVERARPQGYDVHIPPYLPLDDNLFAGGSYREESQGREGRIVCCPHKSHGVSC